MTTFVFNMGFDTSHITSVLARESLDSGSNVILITPGKKEERQENAIGDIGNQLSSLDVDVELETFKAGKSVEEDINPILQLLNSVDDDLIVSLSGGSRDILIPLIAAIILRDKDVDKIYFRSDVNSELSEVDLPNPDISLSSTEKKIIEAVDSGFGTVEKIVEFTGLSHSTVYRRKEELLDKNLMEEDANNPARFGLTSLGRIKLD